MRELHADQHEDLSVLAYAESYGAVNPVDAALWRGAVLEDSDTIAFACGCKVSRTRYIDPETRETAIAPTYYTCAPHRFLSAERRKRYDTADAPRRLGVALAHAYLGVCRMIAGAGLAF